MEQGDRTKKVGVIDSEYIFHKGIQTLGGGGPPGKKVGFFLSSLFPVFFFWLDPFFRFELFPCSIIFQLLFSHAKHVLRFTILRVQIQKS